MSDLTTLESEILAQVAAAADEGAIEAVRVSALGKKGAISERMATLGKMAPEERKTAGAALNVLKDKVSEALAARKSVVADAESLHPARGDVSLPSRTLLSVPRIAQTDSGHGRRILVVFSQSSRVNN